MTKDALTKKAEQILRDGGVIITAAEYDRNGVLARAQLYFWSEGAVMDIVNKDDLVQNWPDEEVCAFDGAAFRKVTMFEGAEDMYFRIDGTKTESDDLGQLPSVRFMETVEAICMLK